MSKVLIQQRKLQKKIKNFATILNNGMLPKSFINNHLFNNHLSTSIIHMIQTPIKINSLCKDKK